MAKLFLANAPHPDPAQSRRRLTDHCAGEAGVALALDALGWRPKPETAGRLVRGLDS